MILNLQALRGIFVILIFLVHFPLTGTPVLVSGGDCGVAFFFMLSGFVMTAGFEQQLLTSKVNNLSFTLNRMAKVYPLHLLFFVMSLKFDNYVFDTKTVFYGTMNLSLLQSWIPGAAFSFNGVSWYLSDLLFLYLVFPFIVRGRLIHKTRVIYGFFALIALYISLIQFIPEKYTIIYFCYVFPPARLIDFFGGMLLWRLYTSLRDRGIQEYYGKLSFGARSLIEICATASVIIAIIVYPYIPLCYHVAAMWWPVMAVIILVFSISDTNGGWISRLLHTRALQAFGASSFVFYLFISIGLLTVSRIFKRLDLGYDVPELPMFIIDFLFVTITALLIHRYFQKKWNKKLRR